MAQEQRQGRRGDPRGLHGVQEGRRARESTAGHLAAEQGEHEDPVHGDEHPVVESEKGDQE
jgi:hypothetical protein